MATDLQISDAQTQAAKILSQSVYIIDRQYELGYAKKNPALVSAVLALQEKILTHTLPKK